MSKCGDAWIIEYISQFGSVFTDQGEVRCKSVATIITVIECFGIPKSEYSPSTSEGRHIVPCVYRTTFLDMKSVAVFVGVWVKYAHFLLTG